LVYATHQPNESYTLHVNRSTDAGVTWSKDLRTIRAATNPGLAINSVGKVGFLYQRFFSNRWETHFELSSDGFGTKTSSLLATVPADDPPSQFDPYLGDYVYLLSEQQDFYGVFCANNTPENINFPVGVIYQRNANFTSHKLIDVDNVSEVRPSIDPFFFKVTD
jgi:hypothetical protein